LLVASQGGHPGRTLIALAVIIAGLTGLMALSNNWTPKLGLDLRGGTTITLTAQNTSGTGSVDPNSLELARNIIQSRVDSLGVGESEVTIAGERQIIVSVPNVQQDELVRMVGQTAVLRFRAVYAAESVAPPTPQPTASPTDGSTAAPEGSASEAPSASPSPEPTTSPTGNNRPFAGLPTAPPTPRSPRPSVEGQGTPPDKAIDWQPSEQDQQDFAAFTCADSDKVPDIADQPFFSCDETKTEKYLLGPTLIEGIQLDTAVAGVPQNDVRWVVNLTFNSDGSVAFENATRTLASRSDPQNRFAIVLDGVTISAPSVNSAIPGGRAEISGDFNQQ